LLVGAKSSETRKKESDEREKRETGLSGRERRYLADATMQEIDNRELEDLPLLLYILVVGEKGPLFESRRLVDGLAS
jgi:hypothetical protein